MTWAVNLTRLSADPVEIAAAFRASWLVEQSSSQDEWWWVTLTDTDEITGTISSGTKYRITPTDRPTAPFDGAEPSPWTPGAWLTTRQETPKCGYLERTDRHAAFGGVNREWSPGGTIVEILAENLNATQVYWRAAVGNVAAFSQQTITKVVQDAGRDPRYRTAGGIWREVQGSTIEVFTHRPAL